jgi:hypothetical protein
MVWWGLGRGPGGWVMSKGDQGRWAGTRNMCTRRAIGQQAKVVANNPMAMWVFTEPVALLPVAEGIHESSVVLKIDRGIHLRQASNDSKCATDQLG